MCTQGSVAGCTGAWMSHADGHGRGEPGRHWMESWLQYSEIALSIFSILGRIARFLAGVIMQPCRL